MSEKTAKGNDLQRGERLQIMLDEQELKALDDFRFANRMPSRAAAIRELLRRGLEGLGYSADITGARSGSFGVISAPDGTPDRGD
ncbi:MAG TPA: ribbon-helix-helix protein, CopG family [Devosia sp.]|jgi:metal-responsive CopG/Arc/MetJ family transcriptional regulator|nr:ribbon-helix-helix protein, CopG family [Devosia sp.]